MVMCHTYCDFQFCGALFILSLSSTTSSLPCCVWARVHTNVVCDEYSNLL